MNKIPFKHIRQVLLIAVSVIIILTVSIGGISHLAARIVLQNDISQQRRYLDDLKINPPQSVEEQSFSEFSLSQNPKINQMQFLSTHNSYKKPMPSFFYSIGRAYADANKQSMHYRYAHNTLTEQLNSGIRGLELDLRYQFNEFYVYHNPIFDARSHNPKWKNTLEELLLWSNRNPNHVMINIIIEIKNDNVFLNPSYKKITKELLQDLDKTISYTMGTRKLITPAFLMNGYDSLEEMVTNNSWPSLHRTKGKFMFLLHHHNEYTDKYISLDTSLSSQIMVPLIDSQYIEQYKQHSAVLLHNEPEVEVIKGFVQNNYMVRARMDINAVYDEQRALSAINSGAQIVTTDLESGRLLPKGNYSAFLKNNYTIRLNPINI